MTDLDVTGRMLAALGGSLEPWHHQCHAASLAIVKARIFPVARVARGTCKGVGGQHSWVVLSNDCYEPKARIVDPTLWSYDSTVEGIWRGSYKAARHTPMGGFGSIWEWGRPPTASGPAIPLTPKFALSRDAQHFLDLLGPLDRKGWSSLMAAPSGGWPMGEIIAAMDDTETLTAWVPIDRVGMLTDRNPGGLYLPGEPDAQDPQETA